MNQRHLITGAQGLVGRHLAAQILAGDPAAAVLGIGRSPRSDAFFTHGITAGARAQRAPVPHAIRRWLGSERYRYESVALADTTSLRRAVAAFRPDRVLQLSLAVQYLTRPVDLGN
jgi:nucleoside-diphosphate-sugar epimerase